MILEGRVEAGVRSLAKFSISGRLTSIKCAPGDLIKRGQLLATLNKKELQTLLDRALKQYDLERALFDEKQKENQSEYEKRKYQDMLDISVKNVEIAKINLDAADLFASINGIVTVVDQNSPGDNITPAGFVIGLVDPASLYFQSHIPEDKLSRLTVGQKCRVTFKTYAGKDRSGVLEYIGYSSVKPGLYEGRIKLDDLAGLRLDLSGKAEFTDT